MIEKKGKKKKTLHFHGFRTFSQEKHSMLV